MKTYQDWLEVAERSEQERIDFIQLLINEHKASPEYAIALAGEDYYSGQNSTIKAYRKILYNAQGQPTEDLISANHRISTRFFYRDVTQANAVLLGNGITWKNDKGGEALSGGEDFDKVIIEAGRTAQVERVAFGFYNNGAVDIFKLLEFKPLYDEEDGALKAGVRFWQIAPDKPMRATMYEIDGYTEYIYKSGKGEVLQPKRGYIAVVRQSEADGTEILDYVNYPSFPIVPCWANDLKQSELEPIRATIDAYDLIQSGYANDVDDANVIYWTITNAGGMDDADLVATINKLKKLHAAQTDDDQQMTPHQVEAPFQGREAILARLEKTLYKDAMAFNPYDVANGAITATQIEAAYDPLNQKLDIYEAQITNFIHRLLAFTGVEDTPSYTRSYNINKTEEIRAIMDAALVLDDEYMTEKIMTILGDKDQINDVLARKAETDLNRMTGGTNNANTQTE